MRLQRHVALALQHRDGIVIFEPLLFVVGDVPIHRQPLQRPLAKLVVGDIAEEGLQLIAGDAGGDAGQHLVVARALEIVTVEDVARVQQVVVMGVGPVGGIGEAEARVLEAGKAWSDCGRWLVFGHGRGVGRRGGSELADTLQPDVDRYAEDAHQERDEHEIEDGRVDIAYDVPRPHGGRDGAKLLALSP